MNSGKLPIHCAAALWTSHTGEVIAPCGYSSNRFAMHGKRILRKLSKHITYREDLADDHRFQILVCRILVDGINKRRIPGC